jgi:predicted metal-dependent enzyme (double-stranded beta helix superfamily)
MNDYPTTKEQTATVRKGEAAATNNAYPQPLARFIDSVETMRESREGEVLAHDVADALEMLLTEPDWLLSEQREGWPDRFRTHVIHVAPDGGFSIVVVVWQPGQTTPVHDHVSWCVVGVYEGEEEEIGYRLYEGNGGRFLVEHEVEVAQPGQVTTLLPPEEDIHRVTNAGTGKAISVHVYGADIGRLGSSINHVFDDLPVRPDPGDVRRVAWRR